MGHYSSFILRLWVEPRDGLRWGLIQHVATRSKRRFSSMSEMMEFITQHAAEGDLLGPAFTEGWDPPDLTYDALSELPEASDPDTDSSDSDEPPE